MKHGRSVRARGRRSDGTIPTRCQVPFVASRAMYMALSSLPYLLVAGPDWMRASTVKGFPEPETLLQESIGYYGINCYRVIKGPRGFQSHVLDSKKPPPMPIMREVRSNGYTESKAQKRV